MKYSGERDLIKADNYRWTDGGVGERERLTVGGGWWVWQQVVGGREIKEGTKKRMIEVD